RHGEHMGRRQILALQIEIGTPGHDFADEPADTHAEDPAQQTHDSGFDEEELFHVPIGGAERLEDSDFAPALKNGHYQSVDNTDGGDGERQTTEDGEEKIEDGEKEAQIAGGIEQGKGGEAHVLDGGFNRLHLGGALGANG